MLLILNFRFAEQDLLVLLSTILRRFRLSYSPGEKMDQIYNTLLFPDRPLRVIFNKREKEDAQESV